MKKVTKEFYQDIIDDQRRIIKGLKGICNSYSDFCFKLRWQGIVWVLLYFVLGVWLGSLL